MRFWIVILNSIDNVLLSIWAVYYLKKNSNILITNITLILIASLLHSLCIKKNFLITIIKKIGHFYSTFLSKTAWLKRTWIKEINVHRIICCNIIYLFLPMCIWSSKTELFCQGVCLYLITFVFLIEFSSKSKFIPLAVLYGIHYWA